MEHRKKGRKLKRTASHKKAMLSNLAVSLILHKRVGTTVAKAKELRTYIEPVVTKAKTAFKHIKSQPEKSVHLRREARKFIKDKEALNVLFNDIAKKVSKRQGGYTRILKTGFRQGDGADTAIIEFVDYDVAADLKAKEKAAKKKGKEKEKEEDKKKKETAKK
ncbi:MAG: 50S ribosomal protein L17 [Ignavibacteria bacterium]|nr:50S ribosomal protein L17 [Ignavibacteria bacterium]